MPHQLTKAISLIAFIMLVFSPFIIPISVQEGEQIKLWHKWLSENPPDEKAKELIVTRSIPSNDQTDINFWGVRHICIGENGLIYATDEKNHNFQIFSQAGEHIAEAGRKGQGPGELAYPQNIIAQDDCIIIHDAGNRRVQFFDLNKNYKFGFKLYSTCLDIILHEKNFYTAPLVKSRDNLIEVYSQNGEFIRSFGKPKDRIRNKAQLNQIHLAALDSTVFAAFKYLSLIHI